MPLKIHRFGRPGIANTARSRRITIQQDGSTQSTVDGSVKAWSNPVKLCDCWTVDWRSGAGRVEYLADQPRPEDSAVIRIRYRSDVVITPAHRVLYTDFTGRQRLFDINAVIDVGAQHQYVDLYVRERAV